jgi:hypothetical protein
MCWSQSARVDHLRKKWRAGRKKNLRKMETTPQVQASTRGRRATSSRPPAAGCRLDLWGYSHFNFFILLLKKEFLEVWKMG